MIKIILAEDHNIVRNGLKSILDDETEFKVVCEAENGSEVLKWLEAGNKADLIITDVNMPVLNGLDMVKQLPNKIPVIMLTMLDHKKYVFDAVEAGISGYLLKSISKDELLFAVKYVAGGGKYICSELSFGLFEKRSKTPEPDELAKETNVNLSEREVEVLDLIADGYTNNEIADKLFASRRTVEKYRQSLIDKTGVKNTPSLIKFAVKNHLIN